MPLSPGRRVRALTCALATLTVASCATPTNTPAIEERVACEAFRPIIYSRKTDSDETIRQVREHNAAYDAICGEWQAR